RALLTDPANKAVAVGEIGLDYHYEGYDKRLQEEYFSRQMALAEELGLPVVIHDREAHGDCFEMVCRYPRVTGVFHSYSGSAEMAKDLIRRGWYISFSGTVTFKNAPRVREVAASLPHERVLIETDAPYLAPHPYRGQCNHSGYVRYTCAALAEVWGLTPDETANITCENARRLFRLPS
ncbi:MAG: TatD family hydrolase, partial [Eubacteriales bacterium]